MSPVLATKRRPLSELDPLLWLVADEPTGDLDKSSAHAIIELLQQLNRDLDKSLILVTHVPATAVYAHKTLHLEKGRLTESSTRGTPK